MVRKTQLGWMVMGGLICLFGLVLLLKLRDGSRAVAQATEQAPSAPKDVLPPPPTAADKTSALPSFPLEKTDTTRAPAGKKDYGSLPAAAKAPSAMTTPPNYVGGVAPLDEPAPRTKTGVPSADTKDRKPATMPSPSRPPRPEFLAGSSSPPPPSPAKGKSASLPVMPPMPSPTPASGKEDKPTAPARTPSGSGLPFDSEPAFPRQDKPPQPAAKPAASAPARPATGLPMNLATGDAPATEAKAVDMHSLPGEPPLAPNPGPVQMYQVRSSETLRDIARRTLGSSERWADIHKLNPMLEPEVKLASGTMLRLPGDACVQEDGEGVRPLPSMRPRVAAPKAKKLLPLTGTFPCNLNDNKAMTLPRSLRQQLAGCSTVLVSPGPDKCLWLTTQCHLDRMADRLEHSSAREADVRVFKRLYFAQTEKVSVDTEGRVTLPEKLAAFADLRQEVVLIGIDDHFEIWDAARWRQYTQQRGGVGATEASEQE